MPRAKTTRKPIRPSARRRTSSSDTRSVASPALRGKQLEQAVERFQSEADDKKAHDQWKKIETAVFGVKFED